MNKQTMEKTQLNEIKTRVASYAISLYGKEKIAKLQPSSNLAVVENWQQETLEGKALLMSNQHVPFMGLSNIEHLTEQVKKGFVLSPSELVEYADFLRSGRLIQTFMTKNQWQAPLLCAYSQGLHTFSKIEEEIYQDVQNNHVRTDASRELRKIRRGIQETESAIQQGLQKFLRNSQVKDKIQEFIVVKKNERYTVPIKASYKNQIPGTIVEESTKGTTAFIEPQSVAKLNDKLFDLKVAESSEVYQIQASLTGLIAEVMTEISYNMEVVSEYDVIFAKAKYSREIEGLTPKVNRSGYLKLIKVRHPLLEEALPLDLELGKSYRGLTITGPNAGGKTVVLKTIGLLTLMTMLGLQIPSAEGTEIALFDEVFVDIGDEQSLENALSTFSSHMANISVILQGISTNSLVLLDELGSGTEPNEGAALAIAIMEALYKKGCRVVTTTHYGEIKRYAQLHPDFITAAMAFDPETLAPRYQLIMGETGESNALWIANKMQLPDKVIQQAERYLTKREYDLTKIPEALEPKISQLAEATKVLTEFSKGDRVFYQEKGANALVYSVDDEKAQVTILLGEELLTVLNRRLTLVTAAVDLYPADYDLASLFTSYKERKQERDLTRGSKKAHKALAKERRNRRQ